MLIRISKVKRGLISITLLFFVRLSFAIDVPIYDFSIARYSQNVEEYLVPTDKDYRLPLLPYRYQVAHLKQFYNHYFASDEEGLSPWSETLVRALLPRVSRIENDILNEFENANKAPLEQHYGENFKPHPESWLNKIMQNMDLPVLDSLEYKKGNRAISIHNTFARALPSAAPDFYHFSLPGQGFPFDNLQESAIWAGTPLYVLSVTKDKAWSLVVTPDAYFAWVNSNDIAYTSKEFIANWQYAAKKGLLAITETGVSIFNSEGQFQFKGYIGAVFPLAESTKGRFSILIPGKAANQQATLVTGIIAKKSGHVMPLVASKKTLADLISQLQNRPYGWGGAFFYNDCSQELKSLFTPLGIWLPRNSAQQSKLSTTEDLTKHSLNDRLAMLKAKGHPFMTIIYIGGHVMLYLGTTKAGSQESEAMTYQNVWGLSPATKDKRYVIGQSLFLPLLKSYPENREISSLADHSFFKLIYLDELPQKQLAPQAFARQFTNMRFVKSG